MNFAGVAELTFDPSELAAASQAVDALDLVPENKSISWHRHRQKQLEDARAKATAHQSQLNLTIHRLHDGNELGSGAGPDAARALLAGIEPHEVATIAVPAIADLARERDAMRDAAKALAGQVAAIQREIDGVFATTGPRIVEALGPMIAALHTRAQDAIAALAKCPDPLVTPLKPSDHEAAMRLARCHAGLKAISVAAKHDFDALTATRDLMLNGFGKVDLETFPAWTADIPVPLPVYELLARMFKKMPSGSPGYLMNKTSVRD